MIEGGRGGANTKTGIFFEKDTDLRIALSNIPGITIKGFEVFKEGALTGYILQKHDLYRHFLQMHRVDWSEILSKKLLPDDAYFSLPHQTLVVIEKKFQQVAGSVDEKLQTCGFKKKQYERLCSKIAGVRVEYAYVLNDWFKDKAYRDVLNYIEEVGCRYYFNELPLDLIGLETEPTSRRTAISR